MKNEGNIEALLVAQEEFNKQQEIKREEERAAENLKANQIESAEKEYIEREETRVKLKAADADIKEIESSDFEDRIAANEARREERLLNEDELKDINTQIEKLSESLEKLEEAASRSEDEGYELLPEVQSAIQKLSSDIEELKAHAGLLNEKIETIKAQEVGNEEVERYDQLKTDVDHLDDKMKELESNPALVEMLHEEALINNELMDQLTNSAIKKSWQYGRRVKHPKERKNYIRSVCTKFFQEEVVASEIDQISEKNDRINALKKLAQNIEIGLSDSGTNRTFDRIRDLSDNDKHGQFAGLSLANLVGIHGTGEAAFNHLATLENFPLKQVKEGKEQAVVSPVKTHLGTINFARAYETGLGKPIALEIMVSAKGINNLNTEMNLRQEFGSINKGEPIIPKDLSEHEKQAIADQFKKDLEESREIAKQIYEKTKEDNHEQLIKLQEALKLAIEEQEDLDKTRKIIEKQDNSHHDLEDRIRERKSAHYKLQTELKLLQDKLSSLGPLNFIAKRGTKEEIEIIKNEISDLEKKLNDLNQEQEEEKAARQHLDSIKDKPKVENKIYRLKKDIEDLNREMEGNDYNYKVSTKQD